MDVKMRLLLYVQLFFLIEFCVSFNVDIQVPVVHSSDLGTEFGFSVELHREQNTNWLLVGAPRAQTSQPDVTEGGAVFRCPVTPVDNPGQCTEIAFDTTGNPMDGSTQTGSKSNQRFGYTIQSSGPDGPVVACAPLRLWYTDEGLYRFPTGGCFVARNDFNDIEETTPCQTTTRSQWRRIGPVFCQAGMSAAINEDTLVVGGPGSIYWQGSLYVDNFDSAVDPPPFRDTSSIDDSYRGYSVTFGEFNEDNVPDVAVGLPRAPDHRGQVRLYTTDLISTLKTLDGEQVGSYFGQSLAAIDIDGDNLDDLIIGAPMFIDADRSLDFWEAGRVYIYFQDPNELGNFPDVASKKITGKQRQARFGFSVAALGDMDRDGFNDFAVGAPFDGEDGMGAVYIFHGSVRRSFSTTPAQTIHPSDIGLGINTFGYSLASGMDMDDNAYVDLLVGAFNSSTAVLLRSRPVVDLGVTITTSPQSIDVEDNSNMVSNFTITTCITYTGLDAPPNVDITFVMTLDSQRPQTSRALFYSNDNFETNYELTLTKETPGCVSEDAYVKIGIRDRQSPIGILVDPKLKPGPESPLPLLTPPILDPKKDESAYQSVPLIRECKNVQCLPDLKLRASTETNELVIGADDPMYLDIAVSNDGEDAFETVFMATFPEGLHYAGVRKQQDVSVTCDEDVTNNEIMCDLGNPFPESHQVLFGIKLDNIGLLGDESIITIEMQVKSASQELMNTTADNSATITVDVKVHAQISFISESRPPNVEFTANEVTGAEKMITKEEDAGPQVTHYYTVRNLGPSNIGPTSVEIKWPMMYEDGYLLYLISATIGSDSTQVQQDCQVFGGEANPEGLMPEVGDNSTDTEGGTDQNNPRRRRRQTAGEETEETIMSYLVQVDCDSTPDKCFNISCMTSGLLAGRDHTIVVKSRLWLNTVSKIEDLTQLSINLMAEAKVQSMPYDIPPEQLPSETAQITFLVVPADTTLTRMGGIPMWIYIVAAAVGLFIIFVILVGLCMCGFFKKKKLPEKTTGATERSHSLVSNDIWVEDAIKVGTLENNKLRESPLVNRNTYETTITS